MTVLLLFITGIMAGGFGALLGLGGGLIIVPALTICFHLPIHTAIGASITGVIATSTGAALVHVKMGKADIKLGTMLELGTSVGAVTGALTAAFISGRLLYLLFSAMLFYNAYSMHFQGRRSQVAAAKQAALEKIPAKLTADQAETAYLLQRIPQGFMLSVVAGILSGMLGVGGGIIKIPAMYLVMGVPLKVATATSNFMIGITAAASGFIYYLNGIINLPVVVPVALGIFIGSMIGVRLNTVLSTRMLKRIFVVVILYVAVEMLLKGWKG